MRAPLKTTLASWAPSINIIIIIIIYMLFCPLTLNEHLFPDVTSIYCLLINITAYNHIIKMKLTQE